MCKVIKVNKVVDPFKTIAGPFKTKKAAQVRKAEECPKGSGQSTEQFGRRQEQGDHARPRHQQREEARQQHLRQQQTPHQQQEQVEPARRQPLQREGAQKQHIKQQQAPQQQQQQTEKIKGKVQEKIEGVKSSEEKGKEKTKQPIPSEKKN